MRKTATLLAVVALAGLAAGQPANGTVEPDSEIGQSSAVCGDGVCESIERGACPQDCGGEAPVRDEKESTRESSGAGEGETSGAEGGSGGIVAGLGILQLAGGAAVIVLLVILATSIQFE